MSARHSHEDLVPGKVLFFNIDDFDMLSGGAEPGIMHALPEIVIGHLGTDLHDRCCVEPKSLSSCES